MYQVDPVGGWEDGRMSTMVGCTLGGEVIAC
jgi:hypothetical protein